MEEDIKEYIFTSADLDLPLNSKEVTETTKLLCQKFAQFVLGKSTFPENIDYAKFWEAISDVFCTLSPRERDTLKIRFGMDDGRIRTLEEVGQLFGVTKEEVQATEAKALKKLRHPNRANHLRQFLGMEIVKPLSES